MQQILLSPTNRPWMKVKVTYTGTVELRNVYHHAKIDRNKIVYFQTHASVRRVPPPPSPLSKPLKLIRLKSFKSRPKLNQTDRELYAITGADLYAFSASFGLKWSQSYSDYDRNIELNNIHHRTKFEWDQFTNAYMHDNSFFLNESVKQGYEHFLWKFYQNV